MLWRHTGGVEVQIQSFLTSTPDENLVSLICQLLTPRAGLHTLEKRWISFPCQDSNPEISSPWPSHYTTLSWLIRCCLYSKQNKIKLLDMYHFVPTTFLTLLNKTRILHSPMQESPNGSECFTSKIVHVTITIYGFSVAGSRFQSQFYKTLKKLNHTI
jgi:hypothetical protein